MLNSQQQEVSIHLWQIILIVKKIFIEGCKSTTASEFKKVGESKGIIIQIIVILYIELPNKQGAF